MEFGLGAAQRLRSQAVLKPTNRASVANDFTRSMAYGFWLLTPQFPPLGPSDKVLVADVHLLMAL